MACCLQYRSRSPAPQAEGTQGGQVSNGPERQGFFPQENAVFVTSGWVAKEGEKLIDNLFLGRILGAGMQVRGVQGLLGGWGSRKLQAGRCTGHSASKGPRGPSMRVLQGHAGFRLDPALRRDGEPTSSRSASGTVSGAAMPA